VVFHIDGNSFYAACERIFRPDLAHSPIAVLTNNDGIIIALNAECKALGFRRGDVFFENKEKLKESGVAVFSSNYTLYADMSARMNLIYNRFAPDVELYSIDESFLFFPAWKNEDFQLLAFTIKKAVTMETGIPVSVGAAPTKTLAKICNKLAKKGEGVCVWEKLDQDAELRNYPVENVWGIGYSKSKFLKRHGITNALALKKYPLAAAKKNLTINGFRTVQELNGIPAIDKVEHGERQIIMVSRSFQSAVYDLDSIITPLAMYTQEAVKRMREGRLSCRHVTVYLMTNAFARGEQYFNQMSAQLPHLSAYLPEILETAKELLKRIYRPGYKYRKVMVGLAGLENDDNAQYDLFDDSYNQVKRLEPLMRVFDSINGRYGRGAITLGTSLSISPKEKKQAWKMKRDFLSPNYTTRIQDIPKVY
jgi:DNA polymerase V